MKSLSFLGLSFLQNGAITKFIGKEELNEIFVKEEPSNSCYKTLRSGLKAVGIYQVNNDITLLKNYITLWKNISRQDIFSEENWLILAIKI